MCFGVFALYSLINWSAALSFLAGCLLILINSGLSTWLWLQIIKKKFVAVAVLGIVIKYGILAICVIKAIKSDLIEANWFVLGLGNLVVATLLVAVLPQEKIEESESV